MPHQISNTRLKHPLAAAVACVLLLQGCSHLSKPSSTQAMQDTAERNVLSEPVSIAPPAPVPMPMAAGMPPPSMMSKMAAMGVMPTPMPPQSQEQYAGKAENEVKSTQAESISTLSLDVDTGAYANIRRMIRHGQMPPADAVRIEELLNYFPYQNDPPSGQHPFAVSTEVGRAPWQPKNLLLKVAVKATEVSAASQPPANLVFLVDVSGSMNDPEKLPLAQASLRLLTQKLRPQDRVSMVVYAGRTAVELPSTKGSDKATILAAIDRLTAGGSTNGEAALKLAYQQAEQHLIKGGINRILLMTDGDFNVGVSNPDDIKAMVAKAREGGISLSTLGFGQGNYNEAMMEQIADVGNGNYSYIDSLDEAKKVLGDELSATFNTVAKDVKLQLEFNPATIKEWRLIGYENRVLNEQDFKNDKIDAAEVGAGKSVVALYELTPVGEAGLLADRRYGEGKPVAGKTNEFGVLRVRYKAPQGQTSTEFGTIIPASISKQPSADLQFAAAVAGFGQLLKDSKYSGTWSYAQSAALAKQGVGVDRGGYRQEFVKLAELTQSLSQSGKVAAE